MLYGMKFAIAIALAICFSSVSARDTCSNESLMHVKRLAEKKYAGWRVVALSDLAEDDKKIWMKANPKSCPGLVSGRFDGSDVQSYAINLIKNVNGKNMEMLIVKKAAKWRVLSEPQETYRISVVRALPPGRYGSLSDGTHVTTRSPVIGYEAIEAGSVIYIWKSGKYIQIMTSE
jgi:hypothetical protein